MVDLKDRLVEEDFSAANIVEVLKQPISYEHCNKVIEIEKENSLNWLKQALEKPKQPATYNEILRTILNLQDQRISELEKNLKFKKITATSK